MARIALVCDHEEGHLLPTFKLARRLLARGHTVTYLSVPDGGDLITRRGFEFVPILEDSFPAGSLPTLRQSDLGQGSSGAGILGDDAGFELLLALCETTLPGLLRAPVLEKLGAGGQPDLLLVLSFLPLDPLVLHYRYGIPIVLLTPMLREPGKERHARLGRELLLRLRTGALEFFELAARRAPRARRLEELTAVLQGMRELVLCPRELDLPGAALDREEEVFYVEPSVDLPLPAACQPGGAEGRGAGRRDRAFPWGWLDPGRRLVYCAMGSQSFLAGRDRLRRFLATVVAAMAGRPGWQLVLATGRLLQESDLPTLPANVMLVSWAPQVELLSHAAVMISHAGLGTVKECIFNAVPMVVFPLVRDQADNARRVVHHRLGLQGSLDSCSPEEVFDLVSRLDEDAEVRQGLHHMRRRFLELEEQGPSVPLIEEVLARAGRPEAAAPRER